MAGVGVQVALVDQEVPKALVGQGFPEALVGQEVQALVVAHHQSSLVTASSSTEHSNCNQPKRTKQIDNCKETKKGRHQLGTGDE